MLIQHIDDRDRWQWKLHGSAEIHAALGSYKPWSFEQWKDLLMRLKKPKWATMFEAEGHAILRAQKKHVECMAKQARKCAISVPSFVGQNCADTNYPYEVAIGLAVNAPIHQSEIGHELANQSGTYGLVWHVGSDSRVRCSLRSNGDYDVSSIARSFGGGGHRNAAGFETDIETLMGWLK
jgi:oligoribonuclease NrnB/cAMP/cGMP phosphodiesterase (DHH superfamily)